MPSNDEYHDDGVYLGAPDDSQDAEEALTQFEMHWMANIRVPHA